MLNQETKRRIDALRDVLVGKVPDPKAQVEQITIALIYKFMNDMDELSKEFGGDATFFKDDYKKYSWSSIMSPSNSGSERVHLYMEGIEKMNVNPNIPQLFRDIFRGAFLPYRDPETLHLFLKSINDFSYEHSEDLGDAYEYLLSVLGSQGDAGQFRTPRHIIDMIVELVAPSKNQTILDPACGTSGFLISAYKHILNTNMKDVPGDLLSPDDKKNVVKNLCGYDISPDMVRLSRANMYLHGFPDPKIYEYDTLTSQDRWNDCYDVILANPPFMTPKGGIKPHNRFSVQANRSEVLFVDYIAEHLNPNGKAGVIVPEGIMFTSSNAYKGLRKFLVENNYLYSVISLPSGVFQPYAGVKTSILLIDRALAKKTNKILFIKIENDGFDLGAQRKEISGNEIPRVVDLIQRYKIALQDGANFELNEEETEYATIVETDKIASSGDYNLSGNRYKEIKISNAKWEFEEIESVAEVFIDGDWVESKDQSESGIRLIQTGNVGCGEFIDKVDKARYISEEKFVELNCTEVLAGDVLVSRLPDPIGRACIVPLLNKKMITSVDCTIIRFKTSKILPEFFIYLTYSDVYYINMSKYLTGASRQRISRANLGKITIPLPPIELQHEIVTELNSYQNIINGAKQVINNYLPTIKLNPEWPMMELREVCSLISGQHIESDKYSNLPIGTPYITGPADFGLLHPVITKFTNEPKVLAKQGDILITVKGSGVGKLNVVDIDTVCISRQLMAIRATNILPMFVYYILLQKSEYYRNKATSAAIPGLTREDVLETLVPVPPLEVQERVLEEINNINMKVAACRDLVSLYEGKIKQKITEIWG
ncbi:MAG: hypothetical protein A2Y23_07115 [Clostridiales bacterium GWB2_37_7]|nr:MAG: hypothetical protein A2Y23_07115 [Clostridiales bacterium GWB2_37_7]